MRRDYHVPHIKVKPPGPKARAVLKKDKRYITPSYTRAYPLVAKRGQGLMIEDEDGNRYLDFSSGGGVCNTGHCHPEVVAEIQKQSEQLIHMIGTDYYYQLQADLAEELCRITPGRFPKKVFMTNSGAESVEAAIKLARYATKRPRFIAFIGAFHGRTMGAVSLTASKAVQRRHFAPLMSEITHTPYPYCYRCTFNLKYPGCKFACLRYIEETLFAKVAPPEEVAAFVVEPIQGEGGYIVPPPGYLKELQKLGRKYGILLIADEIQSGFGRTGKMFSVEHWGVVPDSICLAKGIASGLPLGAMVARADLHIWPSGAHANTFGANPVACAAALKTIELLESSLVKNSAKMGVYLTGKLRRLQKKYKIIDDVRGKGLMIGLEIVKDKKTRTPDPAKREKIVQDCFRNGILFLGCGENCLRFYPPLVVTKPEIDIALTVFEKAVKKYS